MSCVRIIQSMLMKIMDNLFFNKTLLLKFYCIRLLFHIKSLLNIHLLTQTVEHFRQLPNCATGSNRF